jgi:hypothetical protein
MYQRKAALERPGSIFSRFYDGQNAPNRRAGPHLPETT